MSKETPGSGVLCIGIKKGEQIQIGPDITITFVGRVPRPSGKQTAWRVLVDAPNHDVVRLRKTEAPLGVRKLEGDGKC